MYIPIVYIGRFLVKGRRGGHVRWLLVTPGEADVGPELNTGSRHTRTKRTKPLVPDHLFSFSLYVYVYYIYVYGIKLLLHL